MKPSITIRFATIQIGYLIYFEHLHQPQLACDRVRFIGLPYPIPSAVTVPGGICDLHRKFPA